MGTSLRRNNTGQSADYCAIVGAKSFAIFAAIAMGRVQNLRANFGLLRPGDMNYPDESHELFCAALAARDRMREIASGEMERRKAKSQYDFTKGKRKLNLKDAKEIAHWTAERLNTACNRWLDSTKKL
jgi:hypothetical protein